MDLEFKNMKQFITKITCYETNDNYTSICNTQTLKDITADYDNLKITISCSPYLDHVPTEDDSEFSYEFTKFPSLLLEAENIKLNIQFGENSIYSIFTNNKDLCHKTKEYVDGYDYVEVYTYSPGVTINTYKYYYKDEKIVKEETIIKPNFEDAKEIKYIRNNEYTSKGILKKTTTYRDNDNLEMESIYYESDIDKDEFNKWIHDTLNLGNIKIRELYSIMNRLIDKKDDTKFFEQLKKTGSINYLKKLNI